jgi:hypothetical protein
MAVAIQILGYDFGIEYPVSGEGATGPRAIGGRYP